MKKSMNKRKILIIIAIAGISLNIPIFCKNIITFFMKPYPTIYPKEVAIRKAKKLKKPGKLSKYMLKAMLNKHVVSGIFFTYGGYLAISDLNGQVTFPREHAAPEITLLITNNIIPIMMLHNTVAHWKIENNIPVKVYKVKRKEDKESESFIWDVKRIKPPENNIISNNTIVIMANPKYIIVPTGITVTSSGPQLTLPNIYVRNGINKVHSSLYTLGIKHFFTPTEKKYKKDKKRYSHKFRELPS